MVKLVGFAKKADYSEPDFTHGFRASQYFAGFLPRLKEGHQKVLKEEAKRAKPAAKKAEAPKDKPKSIALPKLAQQNYTKLSGGRFAPHNRLGAVNEEALAAPYSEAALRDLPKGSSGNVIVGCMKNEGPYIVEWVAYHRAIGIDNFLIYTNGCDDGTSEILDR